jgi:peptide/nickel transport system substrate-binding protein
MNIFWKTIKSFNRRERLFALILLAVFTISLASIIWESPDFNISSTEKTYSEALLGELKHINPVFTEFSEADADVSSLVFSGLVKYDPTTKVFQEDLATHTLSEDKLVYTFTLKNDVYWQDGTPVSGEDIYYTFAEVIQSDDFNNPILKSSFTGVKIELTNSRTVTFTLDSANSFFFSALTVGILPKHILAEVPVADLAISDFNKQPIGTGPYMVSEPYTTDENGVSTVTLKLSPNYYGEKASIETLRFVTYPTLNDLVENRASWAGAARIRDSLLSEIDTSDLNAYSYSLPQYTALFFNTDSQNLLANKTRLGISKAIDKTEIINSIGSFSPIDTPLLELNQSDWIHTQNSLEAQGSFHDAGWDLAEGATFRTNEDGETLSLRLIRRDFTDTNLPQEEVAMQTAEIIKSQLAELGVEIIIEKYNADEIQNIIAKRDYDMLLYGQSLGYNLDTFSFWHSSQVSETGLNLSNYNNPKADFLIEQIRGTFDETEKQDYLNDLAEVIASDIPAVFLYTPSYYYVVDKSLSGIDVHNLLQTKDRFYNIYNWILQ